MSPVKNIIFFQLLFLLGVSSANNILHQADSLYLIRDYNSALSQYQQVLNKDKFLSNNFELNFKLGICYYSNGDYEQAYQTFESLTDYQAELKAYRDYFLFLSALDCKPVTQINNLGNKIHQPPLPLIG